MLLHRCNWSPMEGVLVIHRTAGVSVGHCCTGDVLGTLQPIAEGREGSQVTSLSRIETVPLMRDTAVKGPPILTLLINMSQSRGFEGGQTITIIANDDEDENYEHMI